MATITINGELRHDETLDLQDSDVDLINLPTEFSDRLFDPISEGGLALDSTFADDNGVGESPDDFITVTGTSGDPNLSFSVTDGTDSELFTLDPLDPLDPDGPRESIYLFADPDNPNIVYGIDTDDGFDPVTGNLLGGDIILALYLEPAADGLTAKVWSVLFEPLFHGDPTDPDDTETLQGLGVSASSELSFPFDDVKAGNFYYIMLGDPEAAVLISSSDPDNVTTNTSQGGIGATVGLGSQMAGEDNTFVLTYVTGANSAHLNSPSPPNKHWGEESHIAEALPSAGQDGGADTLEGTGGSISISQGQGGEPASLVLAAYDTDLETGSTGGDDDYSDGLNDDDPVAITSVTIVDAGGSVTASASEILDEFGEGTGTWLVTNLEAGDVIQYTTDGDHNRVTVSYNGDNPDADGAFDIGGVSLNQSTSDTFGLTNIFFDDDGPTEGPPVAPPMLVLDETRPVDEDSDDGSAPAGLASTRVQVFDPENPSGDFGTDGGGTVSYALQLESNSSEPIGSGMYALDATDTDDVAIDGDGIGKGEEITLSQEVSTGDIVGTSSAGEHFRISIDGDGKLTFSQSINVWHGDTADHDDTATLTAAGTITAVETVTDAEGDSVSTTRDFSDGVFKIQDDGPSAAVDPAAEVGMAIVDESPEGTDPGGDNDPAGVASDSFSVADNFATGVDYGTDGPGSVSYALALSADGVGSGLFALEPGDTSDTDTDGIGQGEEITLSQSGDTITGSVGGTDYFTIAINPGTGVVTFTQINNIWHGDTADHDDTETLTVDGEGEFLKVVQTVTDADGDTATAELDLSAGVFKIQDDGPSIDGLDGGTVAFEANATTGDTGFLDYGTDGAGSLVFTSYTESVDGGAALGTITGSPTNGDTVITYSNEEHGDLFQVTLDGDEPDGYTFEVLQDAPQIINEIDFSSVKAQGPKEQLTVENITFDGGFFSDGGDGWQFEDIYNNIEHFIGSNTDDVNPNNGGGIGIGDGNIQRLETLCIDVTGSEADISGVRFVLDGVGGGVPGSLDVWWVAVDDNGDIVATGSETTEDINASKSVELADGTITNGEFVFIEPEVTFDQIYVAIDPTDIDGNDKVRINNIATLEQLPIDDLSFDFEVKATDADGDMATGTFTVVVDGDGIIG